MHCYLYNNVHFAMHDCNVYFLFQDKFTHLLQILPDIHVISERGEEFLLYRHLNGNAPSQTLLMEMLHTKKK